MWEDNVRLVTPYTPGEQPKEKNLIKLNTNENPYPPAPGVERALRTMDPFDFRKYPDPTCDHLITAVSDAYGIDKEKIFVGVGSDDVLAMAFMTFFNGNKEILFPDVTYSFYDVWAELLRIPYRQIPLKDDFSLDSEDYKAANGGLVIANPNAPTGLQQPLSAIEDIVRANGDSVVIVDEAYIDFGVESALPLIDKYENLLVVQTFSKSRSMAGMRIGYAVGNEKLIRCINDVKYSYNSYTMSRLAIAIGTESIADDTYFKETVAKVIKTRTWFSEALEAIGFTVLPSAANFVFAKPPRGSAKALFQKAREAGILVRYFEKPRIDEYLRISIGRDEEMQTFVDFLKKQFEA